MQLWRKRSSGTEAALPLLISEWPFDDALARVDRDLHCLEISPQLGRWMREADASSLAELVKPTSYQKLREMAAGSSEASACRLTLATGRSVDAEIRIIRGERVLSLRDQAAVRDLEGKLVRAKLNAELALQSRAEFLGRMSHELRTPLNSVIGFAEMIEAELHGSMHPEPYRSYLQNILSGGRQLLERIDHLGAVSEAELGVVDPSFAEHSLGEIVERAVGHLHRFAFDRDVQVEIASVDDLVVRVDAMLMIGAVGRLVANAIAACEPGGRVTLVAGCGKDGRPSIRIHDQGQGMAPSLVAALTAAFDTAGESQQMPDISSFGCGLVLCREYLQLHGAALQVVRSDARGTTIEIGLPAERLVEGAAAMRRYAAA